MPMQYKVTASEVKQRYFTCERCGAYGEVQFQAIGESGWRQESIFTAEDAQTAAATDAADALQADADRVIGMIRCPACKLRPKGAFTGAYFRVGTPTLLGLVAIFYSSAFIWLSAICGAFAAALLYMELKRLGRANRAMVYKLTKPDAKKDKKEKQYKPLHPSRPQPARPATAPVAPVRTSAPEIVQPRGPDEGPGFLK